MSRTFLDGRLPEQRAGCRTFGCGRALADAARPSSMRSSIALNRRWHADRASLCHATQRRLSDCLLPLIIGQGSAGSTTDHLHVLPVR